MNDQQIISADAFQGSWPHKEASKINTPTSIHSTSKSLRGWYINDTQTGILLGIPRSARCVQRFDDSLNSAIHITYRISLRSSSMREPRDPLLKVVYVLYGTEAHNITFHNIHWGYMKEHRPENVRRGRKSILIPEWEHSEELSRSTIGAQVEI